jgi:pimeloyl-ACP methyl ester carboxylesterase
VSYLRGYGTTRFLSSDTLRNGQQSALAADVVALMDALAIDRAIVAGFDWGARTANIVGALWPDRCKGMVSVGRAGYEKYCDEFARLIWRTASPKWRFDDATFDRTAKAFNNPDHVSLVIHNYRWRLGLVEGESMYDELETVLAAGPVITVPTVTLEGDANGAPHPDPAS